MIYKNKTFLIVGVFGKIGNVIASHILSNGGVVIGIDIKNNIFKNQKHSKKKFYFFKKDLCKKKNLLNLKKFLILKKFKINSVIYCMYPTSKNWGRDFLKLNFEDLKKDINLQLSVPIYFAKEIISYFIKKKINGNLIFLSSIQGLSAPKFEHYKNTKMISPIEYSAAKAGINNITKYLAKYLKGKKININCISPGGILFKQDKRFIKKYKKSCLSKGLLNPEDLLSSFDLLLDERSKFINGQNLIVDDGWSL